MSASNSPQAELVTPIPLSKIIWGTCLITFLVLWVIALLLWWQFGWDKSIVFALNNSNFHDSVLVVSQFFSRHGMQLVVLIYLIHLIRGLKTDNLGDKRMVFMLIILSFAISGISGDLLKGVFNRARPIALYADQIACFTSAGSPAFPSGHATKVTALVLPFLFFITGKNQLYKISKYILVVLAFLVCLSRIVLGAHYGSDVLAGIGLAFLGLPISVFLTNRFSIKTKMTQELLDKVCKKWVFVYIGLGIILFML